MKKLCASLTLVLLTSAVVIMSGYWTGYASGDAIGHARQHEINNSGIQGHIFVVDNGSNLVVVGAATGMDPTKSYFSLFYDKGSLPGGPNACVPSANSDLTGPQMFIANWSVDPEGTGTLVRPSKTGAAYVPLSDIGTVSIRQNTPGQNPPFFNIVVACGEVARNPL